MITAITAVLVVAAAFLYYMLGFALAFFIGENAIQRIGLGVLFVLTGFAGLVVVGAIYMGITVYFTGRLIRKWSK